ncbi:hypothetical protein F0562_001950 [Nyssa sinensis]|uniref:Uncharacterized protein n=1 Tax=Nyssa sinensis TaxID=561372 RepID=A0A5J5C5N6_9ASTE|nr:hypothetical protein F0562_001950 [Nyssa sinensis]
MEDDSDDSEVWEDDSTVEDAVIEQHGDKEATGQEVAAQDLDAAGDLPVGDAVGDLPVGESPSPNRRRTRRQPTWMRDYVTELEDSEGEAWMHEEHKT